MRDHITLIGVEEVSRAGSRISSAADSMNRAANQIDSSLDMFLRRFEELVERMEIVVTKTIENDLEKEEK